MLGVRLIFGLEVTPIRPYLHKMIESADIVMRGWCSGSRRWSYVEWGAMKAG